MERKDYLIQEYVKYLESVSKEEVISSVKPVIEQLPVSSLEKLVKNIDIVPFHISNQEEIIRRLMDTDQIEVYGYISYDDWRDGDYEKHLSEAEKEFFLNVCRLILSYYEKGRKDIAFRMVKKLYSIVFECKYEDDYDDCREIEYYSIEDFYTELGRDLDESLKKIYVEALIDDENVESLIHLLSHEYNIEAIIDLIKDEKPNLLCLLGNSFIEVPEQIRCIYEIHYLYDVIGDFGLYKKAVDTFFNDSPKILIRFIDKYFNNIDESHDEEIIDFIYRKLMSVEIDKYSYKQYDFESVFIEVLNRFENDEFIIKYYSLFKGDKSFIILNNLPDELFFKYIREEDKKWLDIKYELFEDGYSRVKHIVRALFNQKEKDNILNNAQPNYLKRVVFNEDIALKELCECVIAEGKNYTSRNYRHYVSLIKEIMKDINNKVDLIEIVKEAYPGRPRLLELL